jgi:ligand-binding SRPBCC domain-containing protein
MVSSFTLVTESELPAWRLFAVSLDIGAHLESMRSSGERAVAGVTSGRIGLGESVTWKARHLGVVWTMTSRITALSEGESFTDEQVSGPFRVFRHTHVFEETPAGSRMTDRIEVASPVFGRLAERLVLVPYLRRLIATRNAHLLDRLRHSA